MASGNAPLLPVSSGDRRRGRRTHRASFCLTSKPALLVLFWNFAILLAYSAIPVYDPSFVIRVAKTYLVPIVINVVLSFSVFLSPLAGVLADLKFGRYKTLLCSSYLIVFEVLTIPVLATTFVVVGSKYSGSIPEAAFYPLLVVLVGYLMVVVICLVVFLTNGIHFGMDQLSDSPGDHSALFIQWLVCAQYVCVMLGRASSNLAIYDVRDYLQARPERVSGVTLECVNLAAAVAGVTMSLCVVHRRKWWFLIEPAGLSPYGLAYRVLRFAWQHKVPVRRSAFTYCREEGWPSRLDLAKQRYGGPFTTEQVEDVKTLLGVLKVLVSLGPLFMLQSVLQWTLPVFAQHGYIFTSNQTAYEVHPEGLAGHLLLSGGLVSPGVTVLLCLFGVLVVRRSSVACCHQGVFRRIGLGMLLTLLSLLLGLLMDLRVHTSDHDIGCMFARYVSTSRDSPIMHTSNLTLPLAYQNPYFFLGQQVLSGVVDLLVDMAVLELVCSQSPHSMQGLLIGVTLSVRSLFQAVAISSMVPFGRLWEVQALSCGSGFYLTHFAVGVAGFGVYVWVARRYKYRMRDEPSNEYQYAEAYYSNIQ